jgi:U4/U6 small nuclear ribonucleoprotein PRP3
LSINPFVQREAPPNAEWWDRSLLPNKSYSDVENGIETLNIRTNDSPITIYIQHPIPLPPPSEKNKIEPKPLKLTTKEQKKLRKQRRAAEMQDHQDRVRMGLIPPDPPKVRMSNMVRVLTNEAVADPTKLEARIRREVQMRKNEHEKANQARKLTAEQRHEKAEAQKLEDEKKGINAALFRSDLACVILNED